MNGITVQDAIMKYAIEFKNGTIDQDTFAKVVDGITKEAVRITIAREHRSPSMPDYPADVLTDQDQADWRLFKFSPDWKAKKLYFQTRALQSEL
jgi:hypothetical protein